MRRGRETIACPICQAEYSYGGNGQLLYSARDNLATHMVRVHGLSRRAAVDRLRSTGIMPEEGQDIKDAIKQYDRYVAEGVFVP